MKENTVLKTWPLETKTKSAGGFAESYHTARVSIINTNFRYEKHYDDPLVWHSDLMAIAKIDRALFDMEELKLFQKLGKKFSITVISNNGFYGCKVLVHPYAPEHPEFNEYARSSAVNWALYEAVGGRLDLYNFPGEPDVEDKGFDIISVNPNLFGDMASSLMAVAEKPWYFELSVVAGQSQTPWWRMVRKPGSNVVKFTAGIDLTVCSHNEMEVLEYWKKEQPKAAQVEE